MATIGSAKATLVDKIDSLTASATAKDTIYLAKALKENTTHHSFTYLGAWAATTAYAVDDVVITGGQTYICILSHVAPGSFVVGAHWDLLASKGVDGSNGASGFPSGGSVGQVVTNTGAGAGGWADVAAGGKVLQAVTWDSAIADTTMSTTTNAWTNAAMAVTFTPLSTTSKFLVTYKIGAKIIDNTGDSGYSLRVKKTQSGTETYPAGLSDWNGSSTASHATYYENRGGWQGDTIRLINSSGFDEDSHTTAAITYTIQGSTYLTAIMVLGSMYNIRCTMTILEVEA